MFIRFLVCAHRHTLAFTPGLVCQVVHPRPTPQGASPRLPTESGMAELLLRYPRLSL